ncbi:alpha/beta hydrolase family protein [Rhodococcus sp. IEGM 1379]|uniref:alpha/beta hydrolase n=1 Tax=Rhodococcus sp. IEGM 1379 TaxID=3047086 RepID=UPI0024B82E80|nr:alpha/beta hydrolase family protein [Rhodococcus sp. IEGM 1379]MDI9916358.1 alpha/beta hydrolase family protein [Rhodococcus sp. IEGM 1379]
MKIKSTAPARIGKLGVAVILLCVLTTQVIGATAVGAEPSAGSLGSLGSIEGSVANTGSLGSVGGSLESVGSFDFGSTIPKVFQNDPGPIPALRDDIEISEIKGENVTGAQSLRLTVASPALRREVGVEILLPHDNSVPRPALYMLEGVDAREDTSGWMTIGGAPAFFADKNVNVVMINGGVAGLYTDWDNADPKVGLHKWETFITQELPPLINTRFNTNGINAIAGNSMGAQGAMMLAHRNPELYRGVAVFSGCYSTMDVWGRTSTQWTVSSRGGDPNNMWGEVGGPEWEAHDSLVNAESLRGKEIYISTANGLPGSAETLQTPELLERLVVGGGIEAVANQCTHEFDQRLQDLDIAATVDYEPNGTHAWAYWRERLPKAWPTLSKALGV